MVTTPQLLGVQTLASEVILRVIAEVEPMQHAVIARALRKEIKIVLIYMELKFHPRMVLYNREELVSGKAI